MCIRIQLQRPFVYRERSLSSAGNSFIHSHGTNLGKISSQNALASHDATVAPRAHVVRLTLIAEIAIRQRSTITPINGITLSTRFQANE